MSEEEMLPQWHGNDGIALPHERYCSICGSELVLKEQPEDGSEPWCPTCNAWRYPAFSSAISTIVYSPDGTRILAIDQYGKHGVLVAGYVSQGESLEETVRREVKEETALDVSDLRFNASQFYARTNTLISNFVCRARTEDFHLNREVDRARWVPKDGFADALVPGSLAQWFARHHLMNA